jgi:hypothetical protein
MFHNWKSAICVPFRKVRRGYGVLSLRFYLFNNSFECFEIFAVVRSYPVTWYIVVSGEGLFFYGHLAESRF